MYLCSRVKYRSPGWFRRFILFPELLLICMFREPRAASFFHCGSQPCVKGTEESISRLDSSVPLTRHDPKDLGLIWLVKKRKIHFRILSDFRLNPILDFLKETHPNSTGLLIRQLMFRKNSNSYVLGNKGISYSRCREIFLDALAAKKDMQGSSLDLLQKREIA